MKTEEERFWNKVNKTNSCWLWTACCKENGYGQFHLKWRNPIGAHVFSFILSGKKIPDGYELDHLCRVKNCVNPDHLEAVTPKVNTLRSNGITAKNHNKTHCILGHEFDSKNTHIRVRGVNIVRSCKKCDRERVRKWREKLRSKK